MPQNTENAPPNANKRYLLSGNAESPYIIYNGGGTHLHWASTVTEPEREPRSTVLLIALLAHHYCKYFAPRREFFAFPAPSVRRIDAALIARRRRLVGTPAYQADRRARRFRAMVELLKRRRILGKQGNALPTPRLVRGDSRQALQAAGAV